MSFQVESSSFDSSKLREYLGRLQETKWGLEVKLAALAGSASPLESPVTSDDEEGFADVFRGLSSELDSSKELLGRIELLLKKGESLTPSLLVEKISRLFCIPRSLGKRDEEFMDFIRDAERLFSTHNQF